MCGGVHFLSPLRFGRNHASPFLHKVLVHYRSRQYDKRERERETRPFLLVLLIIDDMAAQVRQRDSLLIVRGMMKKAV